MPTIETPRPSLVDQAAEEIANDPQRRAKLTEIERKLKAAVAEAADATYDVLMGDQSDSGRKLVASILSRTSVERIVNLTLSEKAGQRPPDLPLRGSRT